MLETMNPGFASETFVPVTVPYKEQHLFNPRVLGMRIGSPPNNNYHEDRDFNFNNYDILSDFIGDLLSTLLHPARKGQMRSQAEENATVYLSDRIGEYELSVLDFAGPGIDRRRKDAATAKNKDALIESAFDTIHDRLLPI